MANFGSAAVNALFDDVVSIAQALGDFDSVNAHEPKSAPGNGLTAAVWVQDIRPAPRGSGLSATSGVVTFSVRIYTSFVAQPFDMIDPNVLSATTDLLGAFSGSFTLDGDIRAIDLLGMYGAPLSAVAGYLNQDGKVYRISTVTLPFIVNDLWEQVS